MCIKPNYVWAVAGPSHVKQAIACGACWMCRKQRVSDLVGRMLAENEYSDWSAMLTLTYAGDGGRNGRADLADCVVTPEHYKLFLKRLRFQLSEQGSSCRFFIVSENGSIKGRVHFHLIVFGVGPRPVWRLPKGQDAGLVTDIDRKLFAENDTWPDDKRFHLAEWPHGFAHVSWNADDRAFRYACKYVLKDEGEIGAKVVSRSTRPILGAAFFEDLGRAHAELGALCQTFKYRPPGAVDNQEYMMNRTARRIYLNAFIEAGGDRVARQYSPLCMSELARVRQWRYDQGFDPISTDEFIRSERDRLDSGRMSEEQALRSSYAGTGRYTFDPLQGVSFHRNAAGELVRVDPDGSETVVS